MSKEKELDSFAKLIKFLDGSKGRDKFCKIIQYTSRFLKWYLFLHDSKSQLGRKFDNLSSTASTGRKLWRIGKSLNEIEAIKQLLIKHKKHLLQVNNKKHDDLQGPSQQIMVEGKPSETNKEDWRYNFVFCVTLLAKFSFLFYWFLDNLGFFIRAKVMEYDRKKMTRYASYPWVVGTSSYFILAIFQYFRYLEQGRTSTGAGRLKEDIMRYFCDVINSYCSAELPYSTSHDGFLGIVGVISAVLTSKQIWEDTK